MPFTVSHVAAVLPAHRALRRWGLFSAAIVGSMVPDFGTLLSLHLPRSSTHSLMALVTFCLPVGLMAWWLVQLLVKPAWCEVLPGNWRVRLRAEHPPARISDWRAWAGGAVAIVLGALTHLVWDSFTHEDGRGVRMLPFLDDTYGPDIVGHPLRLFRWLQHLSSVVGLIVVLVAAWRWSRGGPQDPAPSVAGEAVMSARERRTWAWAYVLVPFALVCMTLAAELLWPHSWERTGDKIARLAVWGLRGGCLSLVAVSALILARLARRARLQ